MRDKDFHRFLSRSRLRLVTAGPGYYLVIALLFRTIDTDFVVYVCASFLCCFLSGVVPEGIVISLAR